MRLPLAIALTLLTATPTLANVACGGKFSSFVSK